MTKPVDKAGLLLYNSYCIFERGAFELYIFYKFGVWRSTQEAEEVPLLRV